MRKKVGIIKRISCIGLIFLLSINSFAAIVSDNDGSAFITKAEFDALKSSFQSQIDSYNQSIDSKIDGAIASYLSGIQLATEETLIFEYDGKQLGDGYVKDMVWTKATDYALRWPKGTKTSDLTIKDRMWLNYEMSIWSNNSKYFMHGIYKRDAEQPTRYCMNGNYITGWGKYDYKFYFIIFNPVQDKPMGAETHTSAEREDFYCFLEGRFVPTLQSIGRTNKVDHSEKISINNGNIPYQDNMTQQVMYIHDKLNNDNKLDLIKFAPLATAVDSTISDDASQKTSFDVGEICSQYCLEDGKTGTYLKWTDEYFSTPPNSVTWTETCEQRERTTNGANTRIDAKFEALWFDNKVHNKMTYKGLVDISGSIADGPIEGGMLYSSNIKKNGNLKIVTNSAVNGRIVFYIGNRPEATWGGAKSTYATNDKYKVIAGTANVQSFEVEKGDNIYVVWLPDTDSKLPSIEATLSYQ